MKRFVSSTLVLGSIVLFVATQPVQAKFGVHVSVGRPVVSHPPRVYHSPYPHYVYYRYYGPPVIYAPPPPPVCYSPSVVYVTPPPQPTIVYLSPAPSPVVVHAPAPTTVVVQQPAAAEPPATTQSITTTQKVVVIEGKVARYLAMLAHGDDGDREDAAEALKKYNMPVVVDALLNALQHDGKNDVRKEAANSLGSLMSRDAQPALRQVAREDRDGGVRKAALKAALKIEDAYGVY